MSSESNNEVTREVAVRVFAGEFEMANHTFKESDEQRAPRYMLLPSGAKANRLLIVGTLTEAEEVGEGNWRGRIADPTGAFNIYAGEYEPEAANVLQNATPPHYVSIVGKPRTFETDDGEIRSTLRPESIIILDGAGEEDEAEANRKRWVQETARQTLARAKNDAEDVAFDDTEDLLQEGAFVKAADQHYEDEFTGSRQRSLGSVVATALESLDE